MKVLVIGDAGVHSGFGTVVHNLFERVYYKRGWDISVLAANYRGDHFDSPLKLYRANRDEPLDMLGMSRVIKMLADVMPDAVVFVNDPKVVLNFLHTNPWDPEKVLWRGMQGSSGYQYKPPIIGYLPIDGYDSPRMWDVLADRVTRVAMSEFGRTAMPEAPVVLHGVDTTIFRPRDKAEAKRALGFNPDRFLILRVDKNSIRKDYPSTWKALRPILRRHPDIDVHFHCQPVSSDGYDLNAVRWNDEDIRDRVTFTPMLGGFLGMDQEKLATLYAAADLFVSTSWGEGFGLTLLESLASGTPVVAQDCSAITEVVGPGGVVVKPARRITTPMGQDQCLPDIDKFTYWIEHLHGSRKVREGLAAAGVEHAQRHSWDTSADAMADIIEREVAKTRPAEAVA